MGEFAGAAQGIAADGVFLFRKGKPAARRGRKARSLPRQVVQLPKGHDRPMTRLTLLGVLAIGATLVAAPTASAKPIGSVSQTGNAAAVKPAAHTPKPRCAHNGTSTNKAGHLNCRRAKGTASGTGETTPVAGAPSTGDGNPTDTPPTTSPGSDQGDQGGSSGDQGDQNDQGDQGGSSGDQGDSSGGDQGSSGSSDQGTQNDQGGSSGVDNQQ
jgi:hypothetical protein